jgi:hypothetical protein
MTTLKSIETNIAPHRNQRKLTSTKKVKQWANICPLVTGDELPHDSRNAACGLSDRCRWQLKQHGLHWTWQTDDGTVDSSAVQQTPKHRLPVDTALSVDTEGTRHRQCPLPRPHCSPFNSDFPSVHAAVTFVIRQQKCLTANQFETLFGLKIA